MLKHFLKYFFLIIVLFSVIRCSDNSESIPQNLEVHDFVWRGLNAYYFWQDSIPDIQDFRFTSQRDLNTYLASFTAPNALFSSLLHPNDVGRQKSNLVGDFTNLNPPSIRQDFSNGLEFGLIELKGTDTLFGYVSHILPNSFASSQDIKRGDLFYAVDSVKLTKSNFDDLLFKQNNYYLNKAIFVKDSILKLLTLKDTIVNNVATVDTTITFKQVFDTILSTGILTDLNKENYTHSPVYMSKSLNYSGQNIGYLMYNNDFSNNYIADINTTLSNLKANAITDLILDLRYNIGGSDQAKNMSYLASMVTGQFNDEIFYNEVWNSKAQKYFSSAQADSLIVKFPSVLTDGSTINSLNLNRVFIINNSAMTSSAVELLINSLKPYIQVYLIGHNTSGSDKGKLTMYDSFNYNDININSNHTVAIQPVILQFTNKDNESFSSHFSPDIPLCEEDILNLGVLGNTDEPILNSVLEFVVSGNIGISTPCNPNNFLEIFNSTKSQTLQDNGLFITRKLPDGPIN